MRSSVLYYSNSTRWIEARETPCSRLQLPLKEAFDVELEVIEKEFLLSRRVELKFRVFGRE
jgi:hypothetical protein